ncbi:MAG TPA: hypothetical protein VFD58_07885 [Blastocatellia bacterium]|nr:hypothetical protein [Blastocatellia bacterium]
MTACLAGAGLAQSLSDLEAKAAREAAERKREQEQQRVLEAHRERMERGTGANASGEKAPLTLWLENQLPGRERKLLAADPEARKKYETFLRQPDTGLFKLIAVGSPTVSVNDLKVANVVIPIRGGGSYYSFTRHRHDADEWAQLRLLNGELQSGLSTQVRVLALNSEMTSTVKFTPDGLTAFVVPENSTLEEVSVETPGVAYLNDLKPPQDPAELAGLVKRLDEGIGAGAFIYKSSLPVRPDTTCVMRSVIYKKADILVAFRVVRQDADGSLHILWKQLRNFPPPGLKGGPAKKD